jgi:multidrug resistance efflux pump
MLRRWRRLSRVVITLALLAAAVIGGVFLWNHYLTGPWTRDGVVRANVVSIAPEVSGRITDVDVADNQFVHRGDVLYRINPVDYQVALAQAQADVKSREANLHLQQAQAERREKLTTLSTSEEEKQTYISNAQQAEAAYEAALASLGQARVNLQRTTVKSPVNGYVTNLLVHGGDYATKGTRNITLVDADSFWVVAYFEETKLAGIHDGDPALIELMGFRQPLRGHVQGIARGIDTANYAPGTLGLAAVNPVFTWVRLAQRIPVHIHLDSVPAGVVLSAGETATVTVGPHAQDGPHGTRGLIARLFSGGL